jgi:hypothetical protein
MKGKFCLIFWVLLILWFIVPVFGQISGSWGTHGAIWGLAILKK